LSLRTFVANHRGRRLRFPVSVAVVLAAGAGIAFGGSKPSTTDLQTGPITVEARPLVGFDRLKRDETRFGKLNWRGGLVLTSPSEFFGGWSGLAIDPDGKGFFAVSDAGTWMSGAFTHDDKGAPTGMTGVRLGALQSKDGDRLSRKNDRDAEGLALAKGTTQKGTAYISFERKHRIARYDIDAGGLSPSRGKVDLPKSASKMSKNGGFEAIAVLQGGRYNGKLVAFSETMRDDDGNHIGWIWEDEDRPRKFYVTNDGDFDVTDAAALPDGGLLVLERRFRWSEGVRMRLRLIHPAQLRPRQVIDADILVAADGSREIDNMEGLAAHTAANGETIVTLISDDNFNHRLQRTILLQFAISAGDLAASGGGSKADQP
jgi:hypothetical protein